MKIILKSYRIIPLLLLTIMFQACSSDDDRVVVQQPFNIVELASASPNLSNLVLALQAADGNLDDVLSGNGPFTVLAPSNEAFDTFLAQNNFASLDAVPTDVLAQILLNHVISEDITSSQLIAAGDGYAKTNADGAGGEKLSLYFNTSNGVTFNGISSVVTGGADIDASNGTIHIVNAVIGLPNIVTHATANPSLSSLVGALTAGNNTTFTDLLSMDGDFTVFAPDNDAFAAFTNPNGNDIANILSNHVIVGATAISTGLSSGYVNTAAENADGDNLSLYINTSNGVMLNGSSMVTEADIVATNGVIHVVSSVIDLPTVVTHAVANPSFSTLVAALTDLSPTDYVSVLSSSDGPNDASPFTVFAPTNDAFGDLLTDLGLTSATDIPTATLEATLNLHVLTDSNVRAEDLAGIDGASVPTFGGPSITIDANTPAIIDPDGGSNPIVATNVQAINGVVHVVSRVIRDL